MKRIYVIIVVMLMAQMTFAQHYIGVGASFSSPFQLDESTATKPVIGWGEGITLQYQYRRRHFLLSIGAALSGEHPRVGVVEEYYKSPLMKDTRGLEFIYLGALKDRTDLSSTLWFHTPVMMGFEIQPFYMMVGAEYSLSITSWTHQTGQMAAAADYRRRYYDDYIDDMFTHGYHDYEPVSSRGVMKYKNDMRLLAEIGGTVRVGRSDKGLDKLLRIGTFAEIGMMNVLDNSPTQTITTKRDKTEWDPTQYLHVSMNHIYSVTDTKVGPLRNIVVGVRVTYFLPVGGRQLPKRHKCLTCGKYI